MNYYRIEVRLREADPAPWRQFLIKENATFDQLHNAIQDACGWTNSHLFMFAESEKGPVIATTPEDGAGADEPDARKVRLSSYLTGAGSFYYQYDFGDGWWHEVTVLDVLSLPQQFVRQLLAGERAFPPEDCGGIPGYENCVAVALCEPADDVEDVEDLREWLGDWHPDRFDLARVKQEFDL
jgi:pRiA4b ORF-3-like protein